MIIGIIGFGFVGSAINNYFINKDCIIYKYDKYKNLDKFEDVLKSDIIYISVPTVYDTCKKEYDLNPLIENLEKLGNNKYNNPILIKSTLLPFTSENLATKYNLNIIHNPEFLSAKTSSEDFANQKHIVLGKTSNCCVERFKYVIDFYKLFFPNSNISLCLSQESESMKIFCNSFYAVKIQFFNELYLLCNKLNMDYNVIKNMMLCNGWINPMHTNVPGTDGQLSYGGLCFPKDTNALLEFMKSNNTICNVLESTIEERNILRNDNNNIK